MLLLRQKREGATARLGPKMELLGYVKGKGSRQVSQRFSQIVQTFRPRHTVSANGVKCTQNKMKTKL